MYRLIAFVILITFVLTACANVGNESVTTTRTDTTTADTTTADTTTVDTTTADTTITETTTESQTTKSQTTEPQTTKPQTTVTTTTQPTTTTPSVTEGEPDSPQAPESGVASAILTVTAQNAFVYNVTDDILIAQKGDGINIVPASVTKLLTALYALKVAPADLVITPTSDVLSLVGKNSSLAYIKTNHKLTVAQLIQGMMMPSGNDAAYVLAAGIGRYLSDNPDLEGQDAVDLFMKGVNEYAKEIGCTGTLYTVPDGLSKEGHYTSAHDLIIVGKLAISNPLISKYAKTATEKVYYASGHNITWTNTNLLINPDSEYYSPYVTGLKTGSLSGNNCVYVSAEINDKTYLIGIFGAPEKNGRYDDAHILIDAILDNAKEAGN